MSAPARRARCRRKACGRQFTRSRAAQLYCSENCRKRASEGDAKSTPKTGSDLQKQRSGAAHLVDREKSFPQASDGASKTPAELAREAAAAADQKRRDRERQRWSGLYFQWDYSKLTSVRGCRRSVRDGGAGATFAYSPDGRKGVKGLNRCASVWACPVCEPVIRGVRATDADTAIVEHVRRGGIVLFVTFTVRHWNNHDLADLIEVQVRRAWKGLLSGRKWARSNAGNLRNRLGVVGTIRVLEVTVGQVFGWHPHLHVAVFLGGRQDRKVKGEKWDPTVREYFTPDPADVKALKAAWEAEWIASVRAANPEWTPAKGGVGVTFDEVTTTHDARKIGKYISKIQGTDAASDWSAGAELARGDVKQARGGNMKAMDILFRLAALRGGQFADELPGWGSIEQLEALWAEYELTTKGGQNMTWSEGLKRAYGIGTADGEAGDREAVDAEDAGTALDRLVDVPGRVYRDITRKRVVIEAREAGEGGAEALGAFLDSVGINGAGVRDLTPEEDAAKWEAAQERSTEKGGTEDPDKRERRRIDESAALATARKDRKRLVWNDQPGDER